MFFVNKKKYKELQKKYEDLRNDKIKIAYEILSPEKLMKLQLEIDKLKEENYKLRKTNAELLDLKEIAQQDVGVVLLNLIEQSRNCKNLWETTQVIKDTIEQLKEKEVTK